MTLGRRRLVRVPASTANLGPGFDVMAAALSLELELEVVEAGEFAVETELSVPLDRDNLIVRAFERLHSADGIVFRVSSDIPMSGGLGSSAAAIVAGLMAADHMFELDADIRSLAVELEGHPDNIAAALDGGLVICDGPTTHRLTLPDGLEGVLVVPHVTVLTATARAALPASVPIADASFNIACAALLAAGLTTGDPTLISAGLRDRLHQPHRAHLYPHSTRLLEREDHFGALGATISGAGPTVLFWCMAEQTGRVVERLMDEVDDGWTQVIRVQFASQGAEVREL